MWKIKTIYIYSNTQIVYVGCTLIKLAQSIKCDIYRKNGFLKQTLSRSSVHCFGYSWILKQGRGCFLVHWWRSRSRLSQRRAPSCSCAARPRGGGVHHGRTPAATLLELIRCNISERKLPIRREKKQTKKISASMVTVRAQEGFDSGPPLAHVCHRADACHVKVHWLYNAHTWDISFPFPCCSLLSPPTLCVLCVCQSC